MSLNPLQAWPCTQISASLALALLLGAAQAADTSPAQQLERWSTQAGAPGQAERGGVFFTSRHGGEWSCSSCHGQPPSTEGQHASTGKRIKPMAPAANPQAFTDTAKVDKWFRRNCKDVLQRECSAAEKADVLAYLISLKP
jgi:cytochrome c peroxidase